MVLTCGEGPVLAILTMLAIGRCAWLRVAPLLSSPPLRPMATDAPGRDGKAGSSAEPESMAQVIAIRRAEGWFLMTSGVPGGDILMLGNQGTFLCWVDSIW